MSWFQPGEYCGIYEEGKNIYYLIEKFVKKYCFLIGKEYLGLFGQLVRKGRGSRKDWESVDIKRAVAVRRAVVLLKKRYKS